MAIAFGGDVVVNSPTVKHRWQGTPAGVKVVRDIEFARAATKAGEKRLLLDITMPEKPTKPVPAVLWICGGGWKGMDRRGVACVSAWLAGGGFAVVGCDYRVSGEAIAPAAVEDCKAAMRWVKAHGAEHGIDVTRVGVWGDSAGGHLAAMLGVDEACGAKAVCAFYPITDMTTLPRHDFTIDFMGGEMSADTKALWAAMSPLLAVKKGKKYPPHLVVHGTADEIVPYDQGTRFVAALRAAGAKATMVTLPGVQHSGEILYGAEEVKEIVAAFFERTLG